MSKRVEIVKVPITGPDGTTIEVDGKACTKCGGEPKPLCDFSKGAGAGGRYAWCKKCAKSDRRNKREAANPNARQYRKWTTGELKRHLEDTSEGEYILIGEYVSTQQDLDVLHVSCGERYPVTLHAILGGSRCPYCYGSLRKDTEQFKEEVRARVGSAYIVVGDYKNAKTHIGILHVTCGQTRPVVPDSFLRGSRCLLCFGNPKKTTRQFKQEVYNKVKDEYSVLGEYSAKAAPILIRHNVCGETYAPRPDNFLSGNRCPFCAESRGERRVREYLTANSYALTPQHTFDDCRDVDPLRFDFAVHFRDYDVLIEYDGIQHSEPVDFAGKGELWALEQFRNTQRRDRIKDDYCRANGIKLIRIRHDQFDDIEAILDRRLSALGITGKCPTEEIAECTNAA